MTEIKTEQGWCLYKHIGSTTLRIVEDRSLRLARLAFYRLDPTPTMVSPDGLRRVEYALASKVSECVVDKICDHLGIPKPSTFSQPVEPGSNQQNEEQS